MDAERAEAACTHASLLHRLEAALQKQHALASALAVSRERERALEAELTTDRRAPPGEPLRDTLVPAQLRAAAAELRERVDELQAERAALLRRAAEADAALRSVSAAHDAKSARLEARLRDAECEAATGRAGAAGLDAALAQARAEAAAAAHQSEASEAAARLLAQVCGTEVDCQRATYLPL